MPAETMGKIVRSQRNLWMVLLLFGPRVAAEEFVRRAKERCRSNGTKYNRAEAISQAARMFHIDEGALINWMNRAKQRRRPR